VLAAGAGTRLAPLTALRPKALCPVGNVPLVDLAVARAERLTDAVAVNVHHGRVAMERHLAGRVHLSIEAEEALGTAGALGFLRDWIDGRAALVTNADACYAPDGLDALVAGWDGDRVRLLVVDDERSTNGFGPGSRVVGALHPWADVRTLSPEPAGLYERSWRRHREAGDLDVVWHRGPFVDCGTPAAYLQANLMASEGASVVGAGASVEGTLVRSVVWPGAVVRTGEVLVDAIRPNDRITVLVR